MASTSILLTSALAHGTRLDAEYYQPRYLAAAERLRILDCVDLGEVAYVTDGIHASPDEVKDGGVQYLSAKCVRANDFSLGGVIRISEAQHAANPRTKLRADDVLLTTVGTIGNAAVVQSDLLPSNADRHLGIIRLLGECAFDSNYLAGFLNCEFGRFQSLREATGNVQLNLFIEKIKRLRIPLLSCSQAVSDLIAEAYAARTAAMEHVKEAEALVVDALGLDDLNMVADLTYETELSEMLRNQRLGAEYFMPAKARVIAALSRGRCGTLAEHVVSVRDMWNPQSATGLIRNFDLSDAMEPFLDDRVEAVDVSTVLSAKKRLRPGDVVISRLRSYLKQIAVVRCGDDEEIVGSSEFIVLRPAADLRAETLLAYLRSDPVQTVLRWSQDGTNHPRFDEGSLLRLPVPEALLEANSIIAASVDAAIESRQRHLALLRLAESTILAEIDAS